MLTFAVLITTFIFTFATTVIICEDTNNVLVDERCLKCFCKGMSNCDLNFHCKKNFIACGPYTISQAYWVDAGRPGTNKTETVWEEFLACTKSKACAEESIQNYMNYHGTDCNGNGAIDCVDYFLIHLGGPRGCSNAKLEKTGHWLTFLECYLNTATNVQEAFWSIGKNGTLESKEA